VETGYKIMVKKIRNGGKLKGGVLLKQSQRLRLFVGRCLKPHVAEARAWVSGGPGGTVEDARPGRGPGW
jgi:hypothetical protein